MTRDELMREKIAESFCIIRYGKFWRNNVGWQVMIMEGRSFADQILALPEIKDGLTLRKLLQDNQMEDFLRLIKEDKYNWVKKEGR